MGTAPINDAQGANILRATLGRRGLLRGTGAVVLGLTGVTGLAACSPSGSKAAKKGGKAVLKMGETIQAFTRNFNPFAGLPRWVTKTAMYEPLMIFNGAANKTEPWLASEFSWSPDAKTLTLKTREGVQWSDGTPFTAKDVLFTFELMKKNSGLIGSANAAWTSFLDSVQAPDDKSVVFTLKVPFSPGFYDIVHQLIVPEHIWSKVADPVTFLNEKPVVTGAFSEITTFSNQLYQVDKNPNYWQKDKPAIEAIRVLAYTGNQPMQNALLNGDLEWGGGYIPNIDKVYVAKDPAHHKYWWPVDSTTVLFINTTKPPFDQAKVRQAIAAAMNRERMVEVSLAGYTTVANATVLAQDVYGDWIDNATLEEGKKYVTRNVQLANSMLDEAGLTKGSDGIRRGPDGKPMEYQIMVPTGWTDWVTTITEVANNLKEIGITAKPVTPSESSWTDSTITGKFDMTLMNTQQGADPFRCYRGLMSSATYAPVGQPAPQNLHRYKNAEADRLLAEWAATTDKAKQKELCVQLQKLFVAQMPVIPLYGNPSWGAYNTTYIANFPSKENPYAPAAKDPNFPTTHLVVTNLKPA
jgi:peptide/nickel transport system substrate-binding protein